ncbi:hypothetical protein Pla110_13510 [Polystyrenella longa]|uniref:Integrase catalytic domain-containing protein n=1 Tax=Polystyrenella longa TaxID=2528007 RepID=A0A518CK97_9PLAN|nr:hypothetical protein Pla110_13510 [Polystyrenella longa]
MIARKWDYSSKKKRVGRPRIRAEIFEQILRFAKKNPKWGADRTQGALSNVGFHITDTTVWNVLKSNGIEPAPDRLASMSWQTFLKSHWEVIFAVDFTTVEVWMKTGLTTFYVMEVMELNPSKVEIAGIPPNPNKQWMIQVGRKLTGDNGFLEYESHLILTRDTCFQPLRSFLQNQSDAELVLLSPKSPNLNEHLERFMRSMKCECLRKIIFFGQYAIERALKGYVEHYHSERNHQGLDNQLIEPGVEVGCVAVKIESRERLGDLLKYYYRDAV